MAHNPRRIYYTDWSPSITMARPTMNAAESEHSETTAAAIPVFCRGWRPCSPTDFLAVAEELSSELLVSFSCEQHGRICAFFYGTRGG